jgi:hypothetical protein
MGFLPFHDANKASRIAVVCCLPFVVILKLDWGWEYDQKNAFSEANSLFNVFVTLVLGCEGVAYMEYKVC